MTIIISSVDTWHQIVDRILLISTAVIGALVNPKVAFGYDWKAGQVNLIFRTIIVYKTRENIKDKSCIYISFRVVKCRVAPIVTIIRSILYGLSIPHKETTRQSHPVACHTPQYIRLLLHRAIWERVNDRPTGAKGTIGAHNSIHYYLNSFNILS